MAPPSLYTRDAGMATPEQKGPMTYWMPLSISFCATLTPVRASHWSSSETRSNFSTLPPPMIFFTLSSSMARRTPLSLSLPANAFGPDRGPVWPIATRCSCASAVADSSVSVAKVTEIMSPVFCVMAGLGGRVGGGVGKGAVTVSGKRPVFGGARVQRVPDDAFDGRALRADQRQARAAHMLGAYAHQHVDQLEVLHQLGRDIQVQHGRHPLVQRKGLGKAAGLHQFVQRHGLAREGAAHAGQQAIAAQGQAFVGQVVDAQEELVALAHG